MTAARPRRLLERDAELATLHGLVEDACAGVARVALLEGPAGIGKSTLLDAVAGIAGDAGATVLECCGGPSELDVPFGLVRQLFDPLRIRLGGAGWAELTSGAAALAGPALDVAVEPAVGADRLHATLHGLYWLTANLAADAPVVLLVDDVQWGDPASLRWLAYLIRRVSGLRALVVLASRPDPGAAAALLTEVLTQVSVPPIHPAPLGPRATTEVVRAVLGEQATETFSAACHRATGGNPFLLGALTLSMREAGIRPTDQAAGAVDEFTSEEVARSLDRRLLTLPTGSAALLEALAILGDGAQLPRAAALAGLAPGVAGTAADGLRRAGVLSPTADLTFSHSVLRSAADARLRPAARAAAHRRAADLLAEAGASPEQLARHLLHTDPDADPVIARTLAAAASVANDRGAPEAAVRYLRRALAEPPPSAEAPGLTFALGLAAMDVRAPDATPLLRTAVQAEPDPVRRAQCALGAARSLMLAGEWSDVLTVCAAALDGVGGLSEDDVVALTVEFAYAAALGGAQVEAQRRLDALPESAGGCSGVQLARAVNAVLANDCADALDLLTRGMAGYQPAKDSPTAGAIMPMISTWLDQTDSAVAMCDHMLTVGRAIGSKNIISPALTFRTEINFRRGDLLAAEADALSTVDLNRDTAIAGIRTWVVAWMVDVLISRGSLDAAVEAIGDPRLPVAPPPDFSGALFVTSRGRLAVALGRYSDGLADLRDAGHRWMQLGVVNPLIAAWRPAAVEALAATGEAAAAGALAEEELELAMAGGLVRTIGVALRLRGITENGPDRIATLHEAVTLLRGVTAPLELARALVDLGVARRVAGDATAARVPLREGLDLATRIGAGALADRARGELVAAGARPRRAATTGITSLTAQEHRVAEMAADGLTSRAIAQTLFLTQRTVDTHLGHVYQKLGIRSRSQLASALAADAQTVERCRRTFVFTDIVSSTNLVSTLGDEDWNHLLRWHDDTLRTVFGAHGGEVVNRIGDGFFVAFDSPGSAVRCAIAIQTSLATHRRTHGFAPTVRIGVHEAEATRVEGPDYQGKGVHIAARIGSHATGGEILASSATIHALRDVATGAERAAELKGVDEPLGVVSILWS